MLTNLIRRYNRLKPLTKLLLLILGTIELLIYYIFIHSREISASTMEISAEGFNYAHLIDTFDVNHFSRKSMNTKCSTYFNELYKYNPNWEVGNFKNMQYLVPLAKNKKKYERELFKLRRGAAKMRTMSKKQRLKLQLSIDNEVELLVKNNLEIEQRIFNSLGHLKIFGKCFIENELDISPFSRIEDKMFPWLAWRLPIFKRWDGMVVTDRIPVVDNYIVRTAPDGTLLPPELKNSRYDINESFIVYLKKSMKGKGVVMSISDSQVENTIRLIRVLRLLQNKLPIQLVHKGDLSQSSQRRLISVARDDIKILDELSVSLSQQELWFVDATRCVPADSLSNFEGTSNKWLALLFNSFDEVIFLDDDSIPFVQPQSFFEMPKYLDTGTIFFKDREIDGEMETAFYNLYKSLLPSKDDEKLFGINRVPPELSRTLRFFTKGTKHQMESGLVVMKRSTHLTGLFISTHLQIWTPTASPVHGDKELFWLGQLMAGASILFNDNPLGSIGYLDDFKPANKLCSIQPSHVDDDSHTLLWVNSGLRNCKFDTWDKDINLRYYHDDYTVDSLKELYQSPMRINSVIIPPDMLLEFPNKEGKPFRGWEKQSGMGCLDYFFCAYDKIGSDNVKDWRSLGKLIRYSEEEQLHFDKVARVWNSV